MGAELQRFSAFPGGRNSRKVEYLVMARVESFVDEVEEADPLRMRVNLNVGLLVAIAWCLMLWAAVIAAIVKLV